MTANDSPGRNGSGRSKNANSIGSKLSHGAEQLIEIARDNPKASIAAGAAVAAGAVAAVAIPLVRAHNSAKPKSPAAKPKAATARATKPRAAATTKPKPAAALKAKPRSAARSASSKRPARTAAAK